MAATGVGTAAILATSLVLGATGANDKINAAASKVFGKDTVKLVLPDPKLAPYFEERLRLDKAVFVPPQATTHLCPVVWYLSGLTCTHANVMEKGEYRRLAAELVVPGHRPAEPGQRAADARGAVGKPEQRPRRHRHRPARPRRVAPRLGAQVATAGHGHGQRRFHPGHLVHGQKHQERAGGTVHDIEPVVVRKLRGDDPQRVVQRGEQAPLAQNRLQVNQGIKLGREAAEAAQRSPGLVLEQTGVQRAAGPLRQLQVARLTAQPPEVAEEQRHSRGPII